MSDEWSASESMRRSNLEQPLAPREDWVILTDADNTLWDTNAVFAEAQLLLLELVERLTTYSCPIPDKLSFVRAFDQALAAGHHLHLKYPAHMLVRALIEGLHGEKAEVAAMHILQGHPATYPVSDEQVTHTSAAYMHALTRVPNLLPTVREGLEFARVQGLSVLMMTEGKLGLQQQALRVHDLTLHIKAVWELSKSVAQFKRIVRRFRPRHVVVIGDQSDRDIAPAREAGCITVFVPSRFKPRWQSQSQQSGADFVASNFLEAMQWVVRSAAATV